MSADSTGARKKLAHMLVVCVALSAVGVLALASSSFGSSRQSPQIVTRAVTFDIPATNPPRILWILKLFNRGSLVGSDAGTTGVLIVPVPRTVNGSVQADVFRNGHWFSGSRMQMPNHGHGGTGTGGSGPGGKGTGGKGTGGTGSRGGHGKKKGTNPGTVGTGTGPGGSIAGNGSNGYGSNSTGETTATASSNANGGSAAAGTLGTGPADGTGGAGTAATGAGGSAAHGPAIAAAYASDPQASSQLAFAGVGNGFWSTSMGGLGLVFLAAYFVVRRRPRSTTAPPSYRSLVKDF